MRWQHRVPALSGPLFRASLLNTVGSALIMGMVIPFQGVFARRMGAGPELLMLLAMATPIMFPKTSAHGVVVDQHGSPVPNVELKASWTPVRIFYMVAPVEEEIFKAQTNGTWQFSVRKVERLIITAIPPQGYEKSSARDARTPEIHGGEYPTNTFVLKLRKIKEPPK